MPEGGGSRGKQGVEAEAGGAQRARLPPPRSPMDGWTASSTCLVGYECLGHHPVAVKVSARSACSAGHTCSGHWHPQASGNAWAGGEGAQEHRYH